MSFIAIQVIMVATIINVTIITHSMLLRQMAATQKHVHGSADSHTPELNKHPRQHPLLGR